MRSPRQLAAFVSRYLIELQAVAWTWTPCCARAFELGVPLCVLIFAIAAHLDPGTVPPRVKGSSAVEAGEGL